jgi:hypothetical protein
MEIGGLEEMSNLILKTVCLVLVAVFVLAGCERVPILRSFSRDPISQKNGEMGTRKMGSQQKQKEDVDAPSRAPGGVLTLAQEAEVISIPSNEAEQAIKATGGLDIWKMTTQLQLDCVVTFYQPDGSFYLTEQQYKIHPWLNSIQISDDEPQGMFVWQWSEGKFDVLKGTGQMDALSKSTWGRLAPAVPSRCFAEAILDITTAPVRFLDFTVKFVKSSDPVRIQGQWYYPIQRQEKVFNSRVSEAVFYQDTGSSLVDMIRLSCTPTGFAIDRTVQYVRGYDYKEVEKTGLLVPTRIEIFETDARDRMQKRVVKIDCHAIKRMR